MSIEAMKQALEALERADKISGYPNNKKPITALRQAIEQAERNQFNPDWDAMAVMVEEQQRMAKRIEKLEQAEKQEPVAWWCCIPGQDAVLLFDEPRDEQYPPGYKEPLYTSPPLRQPLTLDRYDAGLLNDFGGGNVDWWWDYIRAELDRAYDFYQTQAAHGIKGEA